MRKIAGGLIVAAGAPVSGALLVRLARENDMLVAVDGGYQHCVRAGIRPNLLLGDMDSLQEIPPSSESGGPEVLRLPAEKDDTDTLFAARTLLERGSTRVTITCALGARLDHTLANLHTLLYLAVQGVTGCILDDDCCVQALLPGEYVVKQEGYNVFSIFPMDACSQGVCIENAKYPLRDYRLENTFPVGVSNEFLTGDVRLSFSSGKLLLIRSVLRNESPGNGPN